MYSSFQINTAFNGKNICFLFKSKYKNTWPTKTPTSMNQQCLLIHGSTGTNDSKITLFTCLVGKV